MKILSEQGNYITGQVVTKLVTNRKVIWLIAIILASLFFTAIFLFTTLNKTDKAGSGRRLAEIIDERTVTSRTYFNSSKREYTSRIYTQPVNFKDANGKWQKIDTDIETEGSKLEVKKAPYNVSFSKDIRESVTIRVGSPSFAEASAGRRESGVGSVIFRLLGTSPTTNHHPPTTISNNKAIYKDVYPNTDLERIATPSGLKQNYILRTKGHPTTLKESLNTNLTPELQKSGAINFYKGKELIATAPRPFLKDASGKVVQLNYQLTLLTPHSSLLTLKLPSHSDLKYPITVDPSFIVNNTGEVSDGYIVKSTSSSSSFVDDTANLMLGTENHGFGSFKERAYVSFDTSVIPDEAEIKLAKLNLNIDRVVGNDSLSMKFIADVRYLPDRQMWTNTLSKYSWGTGFYSAGQWPSNLNYQGGNNWYSSFLDAKSVYAKGATQYELVSPLENDFGGSGGGLWDSAIKINSTESSIYSLPYVPYMEVTYQLEPTTPTLSSIKPESPTSILTELSDNSLNEDDIHFYINQTSPAITDDNLQINTTKKDTGISYKLFKELTPNTKYYVRARAHNHEQDLYSLYTSEVSVFTLANTPGEPSVERLDGSRARIGINTNSNSGSTLYAIYNNTVGKYVKEDGGLSTTPVFQTFNQWGALAGITNTGLNPALIYTYKVKAKNGDNIETEWSPSNVIANTPMIPAISSPNNITTSSITWNWFDMSDNEDGFVIEDENNNQIGQVGANVTTFIKSGLTQNTLYRAHVHAFNANGQRDGSQEAFASTLSTNPILLTVNKNFTGSNEDGWIEKFQNNLNTDYYLYGSQSLSTGYSYEIFGRYEPDIREIWLRSYLSFNTGSIPDDANIEGAKLYLKTVHKNWPPTYAWASPLGNPSVVSIYPKSWGPSLNTDDWSLIDGVQTGSILGSSLTIGSYSEIDLGMSSINKLASTEYELKSQGSGAFTFFDTEAGDGFRPYLKVTYQSSDTSFQKPKITSLNATSNSAIKASFSDDSVFEDDFHLYINETWPPVSEYSSAKVSTTKTTMNSNYEADIVSLLPNTKYYVRAKAHGHSLNEWSDFSDEAIFTYTLANTPGKPVVSNPQTTGKLKIVLDPNNNPENTTYQIYNNETGKYVQKGGTLGNAVYWGSYAQWGNNDGLLLKDLSPNKSYTFKVLAKNSTSQKTSYGPSSDTVYTLANKVTDLKATVDNNASDYKVDLTWKEFEPANQATLYKVSYSTTGEGPWSLVADNLTSTSYSFVDAAATYTFKVDAVNGDGMASSSYTTLLLGSSSTSEPETFDTGTGSEGNLIIDGQTVTLNGIHNYQNIVIKNGGVLTHSPGSGGLVLNVTEKFSIDSTSKIDVDGKGYSGGQGLGAGSSSSSLYNGTGGGGYGSNGGKGGLAFISGGISYGNEKAPAYMGSGSGLSNLSGGTSGGGRIQVNAHKIAIDGNIKANGLGGSSNYGGGSGGSIWLKGNYVDITGILSAAGGGGGAGASNRSGCISPYYNPGVKGASGKGGNGGNNSVGTVNPGCTGYSGGFGGDIGIAGGGGDGSNGGANIGSSGSNGGFSAGGGGAAGPGYGGGGGGGAGRIAINYQVYNGTVVNNGEDGYSASVAGGTTGPFAYYSMLQKSVSLQYPTAPTTLEGVPLSFDQIRLTWANPAGSKVSGFKIYRNGIEVGSTNDSGETFFTDSELQPGTEYRYYVKGYLADGSLTAPSNNTLVTTFSRTYPEPDVETIFLDPYFGTLTNSIVKKGVTFTPDVLEAGTQSTASDTEHKRAYFKFPLDKISGPVVSAKLYLDYSGKIGTATDEEVNLDHILNFSKLGEDDADNISYTYYVDSVSGDEPGGNLVVDGATHTITGDRQGSSAYKSITVKNGGILNIAANDTVDGAVIDVDSAGGSGKVWVAKDSKIVAKGYSTSSTNGKGITVNAKDFQIDTDAIIDADSQGYSSGLGSGAGIQSSVISAASGAGYAVNGGSGFIASWPSMVWSQTFTGGASYGSASSPTSLGSGGGRAAWSIWNIPNGSYPGGSGGGAIKLSASNSIINNGNISANGADGFFGNYGSFNYENSASGGGSGGSIYLSTAIFKGNGSIKANGGNGIQYWPLMGGVSGLYSGGGSGGRIAVNYGNKDNWFGMVTKTSGSSYQTVAEGTLVYSNTGSTGTMPTEDINPPRPVSYVLNTKNWDIYSYNYSIQPSKWLSKDTSNGTLTVDITNQLERDRKANLNYSAYRLRSNPELSNRNNVYNFATSGSIRPRLEVKLLRSLAPALSGQGDNPFQITINTLDNSTNEDDFHFLFSADGGQTFVEDLLPVFSDTKDIAGDIYPKTFSNLLPDTRYFVRAYAHNHQYDIKSPMAEASTYTLANKPGKPNVWRVASTDMNKLRIAIDTAGNPANTTYAVLNTAANKYVQLDGSLGSDPAYRTNSQWKDGWGGLDGFFNSGLEPGVTYSYKVVAKNGDGVLTGWSEEAEAKTADQLPQAPQTPAPIEKLPAGNIENFAGGIEDGYLRKYWTKSGSAIDSGIAVNNNSGIITVGHSNYWGSSGAVADYNYYRGFLTFDTSALPDNSVITGASVYFKVSSFNKNVADSDINILYSTQPTWGTFLNSADWVDSISIAASKINTSTVAAENWYSLKVPLDAVNKSGRSEYVLKDSREIESGNGSYDNMLLNIYSSDASAGKPYLAISYLSPNPALGTPAQRTLIADSNSQLTVNIDDYAGSADEIHFFKDTSANPTIDTKDPIIINDTSIGTGAQGDVVVIGTRNINEFITGYNPEDGVVPNFNNLTISSGATLISSQLIPLELKVKGTLTIEDGGKIDVSGKGYAGGISSGNYQSNPGSGAGGGRLGGGGGYGGAGGNGVDISGGGNIYGLYPDPVTFGSGGSSGYSSYPSSGGGAGGGAVKIIANSLVLNGEILANGINGINGGSYGGGGAGGAGGGVHLVIIDSNSNFDAVRIFANGGSAGSPGYSGAGGGGGGGGRVIIEGPATNSPSVLGGLGSNDWFAGNPGGSPGQNGSINSSQYQAPSLNSKTLIRLKTNSRYFIRSRAYDYTNSGVSNYSNELATYTLANIPKQPRVTSPTTNSIKVVLVEGDGNPFDTKYAIYNNTAEKYIQPDGSLGNIAAYRTFAEWGGSSGVINSGLNASTSYSYNVKAQNGDSVDTAFSPDSASISTLVLSPTGNLTVAPGYNDTDGYFFELSWEEGSPTSGAKYVVYYSTNNGESFKKAADNISGANYKHTNLKARTTYLYKVAAVNPDGVESSSIQKEGTTYFPAAPANLTGKTRNAIKIDLQWDASSGPVTVAGYKIYRNDKEIGKTANTSYDDTGLAPDTTYRYFVKAYDKFGYMSDKSNEIEIETYRIPHKNYSQNTDACAECHRTHTGIDAKLLAKVQKELCYTCHDGSGSNYNIKSEFGEDAVVKSSRHPVPEQAINCGDCHDPHGSKDEDGNYYARLLRAKKPSGQYVYQGNEFCGACHGPDSVLPGRAGEDHLSNFTGTPHDTKLADAPSGTKIKCVKCHSKHASNSKPLLKEIINGATVDGNNNSVCYSCHKDENYAFSGRSTFEQTKHFNRERNTYLSSNNEVYLMAKAKNYGLVITGGPNGPTQSDSSNFNISWTTNKTSNSWVKWDTRTHPNFESYPNLNGQNDSAINHAVTITGNFSTAYYYRVRSVDAYGQVVTSPEMTLFVSYYSDPGYEPGGSLYTNFVKLEVGDKTYTIQSVGSEAWESSNEPTIENPGILATSQDKGDISLQDNSRWKTSLVRIDGEYDFQMYRFKLTDIKENDNIKATWVGYGDVGANYDTSLYMRNFATNRWDLLDSKNLDESSEGTLIGIKEVKVDTTMAGGEPSLCKSCHNPHGVAGTTDYRSKPKNELCSTCHDAKEPPLQVITNGKFGGPHDDDSLTLFSQHSAIGGYPYTPDPMEKTFYLKNTSSHYLAIEDNYETANLHLMQRGLGYDIMLFETSIEVYINTEASSVGATYLGSWAPLGLSTGDTDKNFDISNWLNNNKNKPAYVILTINAGAYGSGGTNGPTIAYEFDSQYMDNEPSNTDSPYAYQGINKYNQSAHGNTNNPFTTWGNTSDTGSGIGSGGATPGECINCHNPHGKKDTEGNLMPKMLQEKKENLCYGGDSGGCHSTTMASVRGISVKERFNASDSDSAKHNIYGDIAGEGAKKRLGCTSCHNPHLNNAQNKVIDPDNKTELYPQIMLDPVTGQSIFDYVGFCLRCHKAAEDYNPLDPWYSNLIPYNRNFHGEYSASSRESGPELPQEVNLTNYNNSTIAALNSWNYGPLKAPYRRGMEPLPCATCHDEHGSSNQYHLKEQINGNSITGFNKDLCLSCHNESPIRIAHIVNCYGCHNEGGGPGWFAGPPPSCGNCHAHYPGRPSEQQPMSYGSRPAWPSGVMQYFYGGTF